MDSELDVKKDKKLQRRPRLQTPQILTILIAAAITAWLIIAGFTPITPSTFFCSHSDDSATTPTALLAIVHYATSSIVPQQSINEITVTFDVLRSLGPCNFLVFGLGHDSIMWTSLNPHGTTLFLEEDPKWIDTITTKAPFLNAHAVRYHTQLSEADDLMAKYRSEPQCLPPDVRLKRNTRCRLALHQLPAEVYEKEWDAIMIDAPRGYFAEAPGRMGAIFSAAVMARGRKQDGVTHVFLHDVDRKVEKMYAKEFLCMKYMVKGVERLWHFEVPPAAEGSDGRESSGFC